MTSPTCILSLYKFRESKQGGKKWTEKGILAHPAHTLWTMRSWPRVPRKQLDLRQGLDHQRKSMMVCYSPTAARYFLGAHLAFRPLIPGSPIRSTLARKANCQSTLYLHTSGRTWCQRHFSLGKGMLCCRTDQARRRHHFYLSASRRPEVGLIYRSPWCLRSPT